MESGEEETANKRGAKKKETAVLFASLLAEASVTL